MSVDQSGWAVISRRSRRCAPCGLDRGLYPSTAVMITAYMVTTIPTARRRPPSRASRTRCVPHAPHLADTQKSPHKLFRPFFALNSGNTLSPRLLSILTFSLPNIVAANFPPDFFAFHFSNSKFRQFRGGGAEGVNVLKCTPKPFNNVSPNRPLQGCKMYPQTYPQMYPQTSFVSTIG